MTAAGRILNDIVRKQWGHDDTLISTDCGAVVNLRGAPAFARTPPRAAAFALNNGTDLEMGRPVQY